MPALANKQYETFAKAKAVLGLNNTEAATYAGVLSAKPGGTAARWLGRQEVVDRIAELRLQQVEQAARERAVHAVDDQTPEDNGNPDWIMAKLIKGYMLAEARGDTKEMRSFLVELGKIRGLYVTETIVTMKQDPLQSLTAPELQALRAFAELRIQAAKALVIEGQAS